MLLLRGATPRLVAFCAMPAEQVKQWSGEGSDAAAPEQKQEREFLERMADAARHAWLKVGSSVPAHRSFALLAGQFPCAAHGSSSGSLLVVHAECCGCTAGVW
jgi:hypothetical protein